ncbi:MAG: UDP-2-acetamido-3-amino-2,3-dideoxy-glucuronate N-acetyltransferase [Actinomycetota bacterium]|nr:UDP-2-acetamido-3-amino-2,3-dideoxy-glucuronate N-acetyltransferase [Actinomycetota bacterium]
MTDLDPPYIHPQALCESNSIGAGTRVWAFSHVMQGAAVGERCNICDHAFIESGAVVGDGVTVKNNVLLWDGVTIEDDVFLGPNVVFTNDPNPRAAIKKQTGELAKTLVRRGATVGANSTVVCGIVIGEHSFIGAGSVVTSDVASFALSYGNPARRHGWICICGLRLDVTLRCSCGRTYRETAEANLVLDPSGQS